MMPNVSYFNFTQQIMNKWLQNMKCDHKVFTPFYVITSTVLWVIIKINHEFKFGSTQIYRDRRYNKSVG